MATSPYTTPRLWYASSSVARHDSPFRRCRRRSKQYSQENGGASPSSPQQRKPLQIQGPKPQTHDGLTLRCAASPPPAASRSMSLPSPARAPSTSMRHATPAGSMAANLEEESSEGNKESGGHRIQPRRRVQEPRFVRRAWPVASGRPTNQDKRGKARHTPHSSPSHPLLLVASRKEPPRASSLARSRPHARRASLTRYQSINRPYEAKPGGNSPRWTRTRAPRQVGKQRPKGRRGLWRRERKIGMPFAVGSSPLPCRSPYGSGFQTTLPFLSLSLFFLPWAKWSRLSSQVKQARRFRSCSRGTAGGGAPARGSGSLRGAIERNGTRGAASSYYLLVVTGLIRRCTFCRF